MVGKTVYLVMAVSNRGDGAEQHVHAAFASKASAESDARRYEDMHRAKGSDAWAYVDVQEVRP